jgi:multidrug efflux pump subunit AcrB
VLMLFVLALSRQWTYLLLILFSMVVNLAVAVIFYYLLHLEIHLYSLAGISVSFGMIITNSIVMIDHFRYHRNKSVFIAILAATLTTIGSLCVIFFLKEKDRINLTDFAWVMIINLTVSMAIALWFIPSLMEKIKLKNRFSRFRTANKRRIVRFGTLYGNSIVIMRKYRWALIILLIAGFGIPVQWLPEKIDKKTKAAHFYNTTLGSNWFQKKVKPASEKILGGSLRLFTQHLVKGSFYAEPQRTTLFVNGSMPEGCTIHQLNEAMLKMENYISRYKEVELFESSINNYNDASIRIQFNKEYENGAFPFYLKEALTSKAVGLGGVDWGIFGVGEGFSNALYSGFLSNRIVLEGFNYDQLYAIATDLQTRLKKNQRVGQIEITGDNSYWNTKTLNEYYMSFNPAQLSLNNMTIRSYYDFLKEKLYNQPINAVYNGDELVPVILTSRDFDRYNTWWIKNGPITSGNKFSKLNSIGSISKQRMGNDIFRVNQQYRLSVAYEFIGPGELARRVLERNIKETATMLPLGYKVSDYTYNFCWQNEPEQYYLILLVLAIIYLICAILLESLLQPLAIMALIPVSFIGVFLTFYAFGFNFDQGGFASFILLAGIVVNSGLFIINDFNNLKNRNQSGLKLYIKAYNQKILPVIYTVLSTIFGLIPFIWGGQHQVFWFAFAAGTIGGLMFSVLALIVFQPVFLKFQK